MAKNKWNARALAWSLAIVSAIMMALIWIGAKSGIYMGTFDMMQSWHVFFSLSFGGLIGGILEAGIWSFVFGWLIAWFYNKYA